MVAVSERQRYAAERASRDGGRLLERGGGDEPGESDQTITHERIRTQSTAVGATNDESAGLLSKRDKSVILTSTMTCIIAFGVQWQFERIEGESSEAKLTVGSIIHSNVAETVQPSTARVTKHRASIRCCWYGPACMFRVSHTTSLRCGAACLGMT